VSLVQSAGYTVEAVVRSRILGTGAYGVTSGKVDELENLKRSSKSKAVVVYHDIHTSQSYNLAKRLGMPIFDREGVILEIFRRRAQSYEAKIQVKLAELKYEMPRARQKVRLAKRGEQPGFFGLGKYEVDVYYSDIARRIRFLKNKLEKVTRTRRLFRSSKSRRDLPLLALSGYTGAGKTTLLNRLTEANEPTGRGAFTTLAPRTRGFDLNGRRVLISDTVGFITHLPSYMIDAFRSTLEELTYADFVILLLDLSSPADLLIRQLTEATRILADLKVDPDRILIAANKVDLISQEELLSKMKSIGLDPLTVPQISCKSGIGMDRLLESVQSRLDSRGSVFEASTAAEEISQQIINEESEQNPTSFP
jgi:GTP-binding protein HflX